MLARSVVIASAIAMATVGARAARAGEALAADRRQTILTLVINEVRHGESVVLLTSDDAFLIDDELRRAGVTIDGARTERFRDLTFVSLRSLGIRFTASEAEMEIRLSVATDLLGTTRIDLGRRRAPEGVVHQDRNSAFLNYAFHGSADLDRADPEARGDAFAEAGVRLGGALIASTVTIPTDSYPVRGPSNVRWDNRDKLRRVTLGDDVATTSGLGGNAFVGGIHIARSFDLDPYLTTAPGLDLRGEVLVPSTAEIYVDGALVKRIELPPGSYDLRNVPATSGAVDTRVVLRDPLGRSQEVASNFYLPSGVLRPGLSDYALSLGFRREDLNIASFSYGEPVALGRYRRGLADRFTAGVHAEASLALASGGAAMTTSSRLGQLELEVDASVERAHGGVAAALAWAYLGQRSGGSVAVRTMSSHYATLALDAAADRPLVESQLNASHSFDRRVSSSLQLRGAVRRDGGWSTSASASASMPVTRRVAVSLTAGVDDDDVSPLRLRGLLSLSFAAAKRTHGDLSHEQTGAQYRDRLSLHRGVPRGGGIGYRLAGMLGERATVNGEVEALSRYGRYQLGYRQSEGGGRVDGSVAGGLATVGGRLFATRVVDGSFVMVRVPDVEGVRVYLDNKQVGRTDCHGELLIPYALPNYGNRVAIDPADLPPDRPPARTSLLLAPPERGGAVAEFPAPRMRVVRGRVVIDRAGQQVNPAYGEIVIAPPLGSVDTDSEPLRSDIGADGAFEFAVLSAGTYAASIRWSDGTCQLALDVPESSEPITRLGVLTCVEVVP
jgi:outer membrane usher protein